MKRLPLLLILLAGCETKVSNSPVAGPKATPPTAASAAADSGDDHDHGPGPHGGTVFDLGKWHAEFCVDHSKKEATVYLLSGNLKRPVAVAADKLTVTLKAPKVQVELKASPLESDPAGKASRFVGTAPELGKEQEFAGTATVTVDGRQSSGEFEEKAHKH